MKKGIGPQRLGSPAKMYKSPAKKFEFIPTRKEDGTANPEALKLDQRTSNSKPIEKSHKTNFGVKKPKVNIK
jgi:hypothetical protein